MTNRPPLPLPPFFFEKSNIEDEDDVALDKLFMDYEERDTKLFYERLDWNKHVHLSIANNTFHRHYHMTIESFNKLVFILRPYLVVNAKQSSNSSKGNLPIRIELVVGVGLRYLGGDAIKTLSNVFGLAITTVRTKIKNFLEAVNQVLTIDVPRTNAELQKTADGWMEKSTAHNIFKGCVGAIDGWLSRTQHQYFFYSYQ